MKLYLLIYWKVIEVYSLFVDQKIVDLGSLLLETS